MSNSGIFVTRIGASIPTAADYEFVYNSNWPSLACAYDQLVTVGPFATVLLTHNLGFFAATLGWILQNGINKGRIFAVSESFESSPQIDIVMKFNKNTVTLTNSSATTYRVCVKCYNLDIS